MRKPRFSHRALRNKFAFRQVGTSPALSYKYWLSVLRLSAVWALFLNRGRSGISDAAPEQWREKVQNVPRGLRCFWLRQKTGSPAQNAQGFTLPEVAIALTLFGIISVTFFGLMINYFANITRNNIFIDMTTNSQNLLRATVDELRYSSGVRQTNTLNDPNSPPGGWNTSNANFVIIIAKPAQDSNSNFIIDVATGQPYNNELVYFKSGTNLYRRTLANTAASGNTKVTTCPPASASPSCPADSKLIENLDDMVFTLYDQDNATTANPLLARSIKIDLYMIRDTFGNPLNLHNSIQVTLRNEY